MKNVILLLSRAVCVLILFMLFPVVFSCDRDEMNEAISPDTVVDEPEVDAVRDTSSVFGRALPSLFGPMPSKGCPSSTFYVFQINDGGSGPSISLRLTPPTGDAINVPLTRMGNYQIHSRALIYPGRYRVQYAWTSSQMLVNNSYWWLDNTVVTLSQTGINRLHWPFGADSSTNFDRKGWHITCGHNCNAHTTANGDLYALDWNKAIPGNSNADYLKDFRSPLDGRVVNVETRPASYGKMVDIEQTVGNQRVWFRIAHLSTTSVSEGDVVRGGITKIGTIGYSGNVFPAGSAGAHAHCSLYRVSSGGQNAGSLEFNFSAQCH